jgi:acyl carrier protein
MEIPDLEARVKQILTNRLGIPPEAITTDARLVDDLGMDSLDAVELTIAIERQFSIATSDEQVTRLRTVADIVTLVRELAESRFGPPGVPELHPRPGG